MQVTMKIVLFLLSIFLLVVTHGNCDEIQEFEEEFVQTFQNKNSQTWKWNRLDDLKPFWKTLCSDSCDAAGLNERCLNMQTKSVEKRERTVTFKKITHDPVITEMLYCTVKFGGTGIPEVSFYISEGIFVLQLDDVQEPNGPVHIIGSFVADEADLTEDSGARSDSSASKRKWDGDEDDMPMKDRKGKGLMLPPPPRF